MPSPKAGTVTTDMETTIDEIKKGRVEFKLDKTGNIHGIAGKLNLKPEQLKENIQAFIKAINENKPSGIKAKLIKKITISSTMSPGIVISE